MTTVKREETVNLIPAKYKDCYLTYILGYNHNCSAIVFARTSEAACTLALMLSNLGMTALPITGNMSKSQRSGLLDMFITNLISDLIYPSCGSVLVCTDVVSRELDIPSVDIVVNYDIPSNSQNYIHSVGRATQAGRCGLAISLVGQCDVEKYIKIETHIGKDFPEFPSYFSKEEAVRTFEIVTQAKRKAVMEIEIIRETKCREEMKMMMILESRL